MRDLQGFAIEVVVVLVGALQRLVAFVRKLGVGSLDGLVRLALQGWLRFFLLLFELVDSCRRKEAFFHESDGVFYV